MKDRRPTGWAIDKDLRGGTRMKEDARAFLLLLMICATIIACTWIIFD